MSDISTKLCQICAAFRIKGTFLSCEENKVGHINRTYKVTFAKPDGAEVAYIVQRLNTAVFNRPVEVMENIDRVTTHIRSKRPEGINLHFLHTAEGHNYLFDEEAGFWRVFNYIPSRVYNNCDDLDIVRSAGEAFGDFQQLLADFDAAQLHETIANFHNTRARYVQLRANVQADPFGRVAEVADDLAWLFSVEDKACALVDMQQRGEIPLRVTHNDTKLNNVLFALDSPAALAVIDLDTVMPGLVGADFGDAIRFAANNAAEDCPETALATLNMEVFAAFAEGFLRKTASALTQSEVDTLALSCFCLTAELVVRFLDDYITGDTYFKTAYPGHNLVRARCQMALAQDMLRRMDEMERIIREEYNA